jgi:uncharacterized BrkB/YihY/UPF0761 family membrane protein
VPPLALVDVWRGQGPTQWTLLRGTLPNLVAVLTLAFGLLMVRFPQRQPRTPALVASQRRWFWGLWTGALLTTVGWEFAQRGGPLVFDPLDLVVTGGGAVGAVALFLVLQRVSFRPAV